MGGDRDRDWSILSFESSDTPIASPGSNAVVVGRVIERCGSPLGRGRPLTVDIRGGLVDRGREGTRYSSDLQAVESYLCLCNRRFEPGCYHEFNSLSEDPSATICYTRGVDVPLRW